MNQIRILAIVAFLSLAIGLDAQVPTITSFTPQTGPIGTSVTITGTNFSATPTNNIVFFGATRAAVTNASATNLTVTIPAGATHDFITVTVGGLTAYSARHFIPSFGGTGTLTSNSFAPKVDIPTGTAPWGITASDLDADGKPDLIVTNQSAGTISVHKNSSTLGSLTTGSFASGIPFNVAANPIHVKAGDLDGDGKQDLVIVNANSNSVSILRNTTITSISMATKVDLSTGSTPASVAIGDFDSDGKPDLAVANSQANTISLFKNLSTMGSILFDNKVDLPAGSSPQGLAVGDLDSDGKPEIVATNNTDNNISVFRNQSTSGTITASSFASKVDFPSDTNPYFVAIGDMDSDNKPDLVVAHYGPSNISVFKNVTSVSVINTGSFEARVDYLAPNSGSHVYIADVDGNAKPDFIGTHPAGNLVSVFANTTTSGTIASNSFDVRFAYLTGIQPFFSTVGDLDGDGKPDIAVANFGANTISLLRNTVATVAQTYHVSQSGNDSNDGSSGSPFLTIQHAIDVAIAGEAIKVAAGIYNEGLILQEQITLQGGYATDFLDANRNIFSNKTVVRAVSTIILNDAFGSTIEGFVFDGNNTAEEGLRISANSVVKNNIVLRVRSSPGQGINISGDAVVNNNVFHDNITGAILFGGTSAGAVFKNNIVTGNSFGLNNSSAAGLHRYNCVSQNSFNYTGNFNAPGIGDINLNPNYLDAASDDFRISGTSPAIDAGDPADPVGSEPCSSRINMGAYGGTALAACAIASEPTTQVSGINFTATNFTSLSFTFTNGNGTSRLVVAKQGAAVDANPVDGISYTANTTFGNGSELGTGNYVVSDGTQPVTVFGLTPGTTYHFRIYEFNGSAGTENYLTTTATGNPNSTTTATSAIVTVSDFNPKSSNIGTSVTITGSNFGATISSNTVFFGGARAVVTSASTTQLVATVPQGASHERISVVAGGQIGYSSRFFMPTFAGGNTIASNSFGTKVDFGAGNYPDHIAIADIDNDTGPDVLVANGSLGSFSVLLNTNSGGAINSGSLSAPINFTSGTSPNALVTGDLDSDGRLDVVVTNAGGTTSVFRNTTSGGSLSFAPKVDLAGTSPRYVALGDFDGDGKADLATSNYDNATVSVFRNSGTTGNVSFEPPIDLTTQTQPYGMAAGDLDGDGMTDLAVVNQGSSSVSVFRNNSTGGSISFSTALNIATGASPQNIALGDIDGDGRLDMAVVCLSVVSLFRNTGTAGSITAGSFASKVDIATGDTNSLGISLADLSGDGKTDLAVANNGSGDLSVFANNGTAGAIDAATFASPANFSIGTNPACYAIGAADLNGDGKPDLAVPNSSSGSFIAVFENLISSTVAPEPTAQPTNMTFTNQQATSFTVNFTAASGNPDGYIALMKEGQYPSFVPVDGQVYTFNEEPDPSGDPGTYAVLIGPETSFGIVSVSPGATLYFRVYAYNGNGTGINYLTTAPLENNFTTPALPSKPTVQASNLVIQQLFQNTLQLTWTNGNGTARIVVGKEGSAVDQSPTDGVTYFASGSFSSGDDLAGGNYVVYNGNSNTVNVTDISDGTTYHFFVFEYNGASGSESYNLNTATNNPNSITTSASDTSPPEAGNITAPVAVGPGNDALITAAFTDPESGIPDDGLELHYRSISSGGGFTNLAMTKTGADWQATIPSAAFGELGAEFEIAATNGATLTTTTALRQVKLTYQGSASASLPYASFGDQQSNYRIISVPFELTNKTVGTVLGTHLGEYDGRGWRMFRWENSTIELNKFSQLEPGKGYWLIIRDNPGVNITLGDGTTVSATSDNPFMLENVSGEWFQIGNPYPYNLLWSDVQAANPGLPGLRVYEGTFTDGTVLKSFSGGFIKFSAGSPAIDIVFPVEKNPGAGRAMESDRQSIDEPNWSVSLSLSQGNLTNTIAGFGMNENANEGFDVHDGFTMPRMFDDFLELNHFKRDGSSFYTKDVVPPTQAHVWEFEIVSSTNEGWITLEWDNSYFGNNDRELYLVDVARGRSFDMRQLNRYSFDPKTSHSFKAVFGDSLFVTEHTRVDHLVLHGAYPIPSDGDVTISFSIPDRATVRLEIADSNGRNIWTRESDFPAGYNEITWLRTAESPGLYIGKVFSGQTARHTKFILR